MPYLNEHSKHRKLSGTSPTRRTRRDIPQRLAQRRVKSPHTHCILGPGGLRRAGCGFFGWRLRGFRAAEQAPTDARHVATVLTAQPSASRSGTPFFAFRLRDISKPASCKRVTVDPPRRRSSHENRRRWRVCCEKRRPVISLPHQTSDFASRCSW